MLYVPMTDEEDKILAPGLHDSRLVSICLSNRLELGFEPEEAGFSGLVIAEVARPHLWASGVVVPNIVSGAWLARSDPGSGWLESRLGREVASACEFERQIFASGGWLLAIESHAGGPLVAFGKRYLEAEYFYVRRSEEPER